jgi:hypothetical protein
MKKIVLAIAFAYMMTLCLSCEKAETSFDTDEVSLDYLVGKWAAVCTEDSDTVDAFYEYYEITKNGKFKEYFLDDLDKYASYKNGIIYTPAGAGWELDCVDDFIIEGNKLYSDYGVMGIVSIIDKDTFTYKYAMATHYEDYTCYRIKQFATK